MRINELKQKRAKVIADARAVLDAADKEGRSGALNEAEQASYDAAMADEKRLSLAIEQEERQAALDASTRGLATDIERAQAGQDSETFDGEFRKSLPPTLRTALDSLKGDARMAKTYVENFRGWLSGQVEQRALQADSSVAGGFVMAPQLFVARLIQAVDNALWIRARATKIPCGLNGVGAPSLDADPDDGSWTSELAEASFDSTMAFGKRELKPNRLVKGIKVSNDLLMGGLLDVEALIAARFAYKFGVTEEKGFMTGTGASQPLGLFTASALGIPTSRDVSTSNTSTAMTFDGLTNAKYAVKAQYHGRAAWVFHRDGVSQLVKIKNGNGDYVWRESVRAGEPDTLLNSPVLTSEYAPSTFTSGLYVGIYGDLSNYWIADAMDMSLQRLAELYAATNQTGFIARKYVDGAPVLAEAFARVKLG